MAFTFGDVRESLKKKGFREEARDHYYLYFYFEGKRTHLYTKCSHGADRDDVRHTVEQAMKLQLRLTTAQLAELVECTMGEAQYIAAMKARGELPPKSQEKPKDKQKPKSRR